MDPAGFLVGLIVFMLASFYVPFVSVPIAIAVMAAWTKSFVGSILLGVPLGILLWVLYAAAFVFYCSYYAKCF